METISASAGLRERGARALDHPGADNQPGAVGETAERRCAGERRERSYEHVAPAEQIAAAAADEQQRAERQCVPVHDPCDPADAEPQAVLDRGERDVDDRHVEYDHQLRGGEQQQRNGGAGHGSFAVGF